MYNSSRVINENVLIRLEPEVKSNLLTPQAFSTPQPQPDKYILIYHCSAVAQLLLFSLCKRDLHRKLAQALYCHMKLALLLTIFAFGYDTRFYSNYKIMSILLTYRYNLA